MAPIIVIDLNYTCVLLEEKLRTMIMTEEDSVLSLTPRQSIQHCAMLVDSDLLGRVGFRQEKAGDERWTRSIIDVGVVACRGSD